jgi:uncharacterized protein (TIGR02246 family)
MNSPTSSTGTFASSSPEAFLYKISGPLEAIGSTGNLCTVEIASPQNSPTEKGSFMRHPISTMAWLIVVALTAAAPALAQQGGAQSVDAAWMSAMKANDINGILRCYAPDAVAWLPGMPTARGEQAIRSAYQGLLSANVVKDVTIPNAAYKTTGNLSVGWGTFTLTLLSKDTGQSAVMTGRFTEVAELRGARWVYIVDHASADPAPPDTAKQ